ncbi:MAG TPA: ATP-binding protein [Candidatus Bipolaricaulota bacterium]
MGRFRVVGLTALLFVASLAIGLGFIQFLEQRRQEEQLRALGQIAASSTDALQRQLNQSLSAAYALASMLRQFKGITDFEAVAADMIESYGGISSLQLAPNGLISQAYPPAQRSTSLGQDLLNDPSTQSPLTAAVESGELTLIERPPSAQGAREMLGCLPVYLADDLGRERFWGFVVVVIPMETVLKSQFSGLERQGYRYELAWTDAATGQRVTLARSAGAQAPNGNVVTDFRVAQASWTLSLSFAQSASFNLALAAEVALVGLISGLLSTLLYALMRQPALLQRQIALKTRELSNANEQLVAEIIERKTAEEKYRDLFDNANDGIYTLDRKGLIASFNQKAAALTGHARAEVLGEPYAMLIAPADRSKARRTFIRNLRGELQTFELRLLRTDGQQVVVEINTRPIFHGGQIVGVQGIARDVTERKALEELQDEFVSTVSHELRTPLTSIKGYTELLLLEDVGSLDEQQKSFLDILLDNTNRLGHLIDDLLDIEKLGAGKVQFHYEEIDVNDALIMVAETFQVTAQKKGLQLHLMLGSRLWVRADQGRLIQAFSNLLSNAIKYTPHGHVSVRSYAQADQAVVQVADTGIGIGEADLARLFQRFFRAQHDYVRKVGGTGLGLAIAKAILEEHQGRLEVESKLGQGTTFSVHLPLLDRQGG